MDTSFSPSEEVIRLEGIQKRFGGVQALRGVSLRLHQGETYHLLGENGSGKSTLIKIISGALAPDGGTLVVRGRAYTRLRPLDALREGVETVYQDLSLFPNLSVAENIAFNAQLLKSNGWLFQKLDWPSLYRTAAEALRRVGLEPTPRLLAQRVEALPIALRQLVAIARGIASRAVLVIMDEPTAALTQKEVEHLIAVLAQLRQEGVSVLFVSHKLDEVFRIGGRVVVLRDGQKVAEGPLRQYTKSDIAFLMTGKRLEGTGPHAAPSQPVPLLEVENLGREGDLSGVSFCLHRGEVLGITGLLDSGRNELALALAGVRPASTGSIRLEGREVHLRSPRDAARLGIGYVPEDRLTEGLFLPKPVRENIVVSILDQLMQGYRVDLRLGETKAQRAVNELQIVTAGVMAPVQSLSGGNQQKVMLARCLATRPKVLLLHSPTMGVDVGSKEAIYAIIKRLADQGIGVIVVSDDLPELLHNCGRILVMRKGKLVRTLEGQRLSEEALSSELLASAPIG